MRRLALLTVAVGIACTPALVARAVAVVGLDARGPSRALNEAWFAWRVRGEVAQAHEALARLAADEAVGANWRRRANELLGEIEVELVTSDPTPTETAHEDPVPEPEPSPPLDPGPTGAAPAAAPEIVLEDEPPPETGEPAGVEPDPTTPEVWQLRAPDPDGLPRMPRAGEPIEAQVVALDERVAAWERANAPWLEQTDGRATAGFAGLLGRWYARDQGASKRRAYELSTLSFDHGIRDDPERDVTYNDWCLSYGNGTDDLDVAMTGGDHSTIEPLDGPEAGTVSEETHAAYGRSYLVHVLDTDTDRWFEFRVVEQVSGAWILIAWLEVEAP